MSFDTYFRACSYAMIGVAMLALVLAGGLHLGLALAFAAVLVLAWKIEGTRWQFSERVGLVVVLLSIPLFFIDWHLQGAFGGARERLGVNALAHLIVFLSAVKLLQVKSDRDWVFLYLISFFEVLLAAGLSLNPVFLGTLILYVFCGLLTISAFEIRKAGRLIEVAETRLLVAPDAKLFRRFAAGLRNSNTAVRRLPLMALALLVLIFVLALPLFLIAPRAGSAALSRGGPGLSNFIGFSENVSLGEIGTLKASNEVVMRVRIEGPLSPQKLRWRGVALDEFTGRGWRKSPVARDSVNKTAEHGLIQVGYTSSLHLLTTQTIFLEAIESPVLFALPRPVAIQGEFPSLRLDTEGSIQSRRRQLDRIKYKALSDTSEPEPQILRRDDGRDPQTFGRYLALPRSLDLRIIELADTMVSNHRARSRYDIARAIETDLQQNYGYSLEMKASGPEPLSDFLFNVRAGHCEYFSTAMAVLLRTQGIPSRVVNGFLPGEYNEAADAFTVRQSDAHSWVEVFFPETGSWVTFDPTPAAGRIEPQSTGVAAQLGKYVEALQLMWFQYVIGYDKQEQRSLATSLQNQAFHYQSVLAKWLTILRSVTWYKLLLGLCLVLLAVLLGLLVSRIRRLGWRGLKLAGMHDDAQHSAVVFYERMTAELAKRGIERSPEQTPLEFAVSVGLNEALAITSAYNRVRFGSQRLSGTEQEQIEQMLRELEQQSLN